MQKGLTLWKVLGLAVLGILIAGILYPIFATAPMNRHPRSSLSNMKVLGVGLAIYGSDSDDRLPPYFTFDLPKTWDSMSNDQKARTHPVTLFVTAVKPYIKNDQILLSVDDENTIEIKIYDPKREGYPGMMSYVHSLSLRGHIPDYDKGNRVLKVTQVEEPRLVAYLRDPIRGFGPNKDGVQTLLGPNKKGFNVGYLDTSARVKSILDVNTEL